MKSRCSSPVVGLGKDKIRKEDRRRDLLVYTPIPIQTHQFIIIISRTTSISEGPLTTTQNDNSSLLHTTIALDCLEYYYVNNNQEQIPEVIVEFQVKKKNKTKSVMLPGFKTEPKISHSANKTLIKRISLLLLNHNNYYLIHSAQ